MTTYNTYQEAKIANPECEIYQLERNELFVHCNCHKAELVGFDEFSSIGVKCNPADHCMTVEKFLADGNKFVEGDLIYNTHPWEKVDTVEREDLADYNILDSDDNKRYILHAAALEEKDNIPNIHPDSEFYKKPRTKVEYVKCEFVTKWEHVKLMEDTGESLFFLPNDEFIEVITPESAIRKLRNEHELYRRIETPMTEREAFVDWFESIHEVYVGSEEYDHGQLGEFLFDNGCKLVN